MKYGVGIKTEHSGAKKAMGYWGRKHRAKAVSRKRRRINARIEIQEEMEKEEKLVSSQVSKDDGAPGITGHLPLY